MQNRKDLYEKAMRFTHECLGTSHIDTVDMCADAFLPKKCFSCEHIMPTDHLGTFCGHSNGLNGRVSPLDDYCSKHKERT